MARTGKEQYVVGSLPLLANSLAALGDRLPSGVTYRQWFLLMMLTRMDSEEKSVARVAEFAGTSRQNVKKMLASLEERGYVALVPSKTGKRALAVSLTRKGRDYVRRHEGAVVEETSRLLAPLSDAELDAVVASLQLLMSCVEEYEA
ncbi:MAG: MarR family transcriptional regulator [Atopobiaceae bacterium]|nr:MarR family transcriptional regulator [Atopobiaceae bacterium]